LRVPQQRKLQKNRQARTIRRLSEQAKPEDAQAEVARSTTWQFETVRPEMLRSNCCDQTMSRSSSTHFDAIEKGTPGSWSNW